MSYVLQSGSRFCRSCVSVKQHQWLQCVCATLCFYLDLIDPCCVSQPCSAQAALGASYLSLFSLGEGESTAEAPEEEEGQTGQAAVALPGPAHSSVSTAPKPLWQIRIESMHHIIAMIHCSPKSKCALKALRPLNHHVCLSVCALFKEASETDREWMS